MSSMNFLLFHGTAGNPDETWFPWLTKELHKRGHKVIAPKFPTPVGQKLKAWLAIARDYEPLFDENLVLIGRSAGAAFIPSLLEEIKPKKPIRAAFLVAGFCSDLHLPAFKLVLDTFVEKKFDWPLIKRRSEKFFVYQSDNDPYVKEKYGLELAKNLGVEMRLFHGSQHFWDSKFPPILEEIEKLEKT